MSYYWEKLIIVSSILDMVSCISNTFKASYLITVPGSFGYCLCLILEHNELLVVDVQYWKAFSDEEQLGSRASFGLS